MRGHTPAQEVYIYFFCSRRLFVIFVPDVIDLVIFNRKAKGGSWGRGVKKVGGGARQEGQDGEEFGPDIDLIIS